MFASQDPADPKPDAISAVKALQKASAAGQRIYHLTQENMGCTLGAIHHDLDTILEIRNALLAGKEVITHTNSVSVPGWSGAGYIILDPDTGVGAYKIAGGSNGGLLALLHGIAIGLAIVSLITAAVLGGTVGILAAAVLSIPFFIGYVYGYVVFVLNGGKYSECHGIGIGLGASIAGILAALHPVIATTTLRSIQNLLTLLLGEAFVNGITGTFSKIRECMK